VARLLEGSVRRSGDHLRITVQLVDTTTGFYLWSETYDRHYQDLLALQQEIATAIAAVLRVRLAGQPVPKPLDVAAIAAYNLYLKGRYFWNKRTVEGLRTGIRCFEQAVALDPNCALAYAGLADACTVSAQYGLSDPAEFMPKAKASALRALEIVPSLAEAHCSLGYIRSLYDWEWDQAERHYLRAIDLNPGYVTAHLWYGIDFLVLRSRFEEASRQLEIAWQLDPLSFIGRETKGYLLLIQRRYPEAVTAHRAFVDDEPTYYKGYTSLGRALTQVGRYSEAIEAYERGRALAGDIPNILGALGQTYALAGQTPKARRLLAELHSLAERRYVTRTCFALIHLGLGEKQLALDWLEQSCQRRELPLANIGVHPVYDELRAEPRFLALLERIGLR
jgi:tetratricopeptide (TPR) repeat protein